MRSTHGAFRILRRMSARRRWTISWPRPRRVGTGLPRLRKTVDRRSRHVEREKTDPQSLASEAALCYFYVPYLYIFIRADPLFAWAHRLPTLVADLSYPLRCLSYPPIFFCPNRFE